MDLDELSWTAKVAEVSHLSCLHILFHQYRFTSETTFGIWLASNHMLRNIPQQMRTASQKIRLSEPPSLLSQCWHRAEVTPRCTMQQKEASQRWWSCCLRPMHRWTWKTRKAGGFSLDMTRSGPSWRVIVCLEIGIYRSLPQKNNFVKIGVHIFPV